ncbi:hypothetical protein BCV70DRAFT_118885 [Testicularia cyperi]|uniref:Uncharacterized protein n=1 Tax=Testicularia cyperi TaxID=1882483 RepID=A0A317XNL0_9BASI|nr:hypothetical protein BCV70DRAFT_118885 [Testicularia cyperi]
MSNRAMWTGIVLGICYVRELRREGLCIGVFMAIVGWLVGLWEKGLDCVLLRWIQPLAQSCSSERPFSLRDTARECSSFSSSSFLRLNDCSNGRCERSIQTAVHRYGRMCYGCWIGMRPNVGVEPVDWRSVFNMSKQSRVAAMQKQNVNASATIRNKSDLGFVLEMPPTWAL